MVSGLVLGAISDRLRERGAEKREAAAVDLKRSQVEATQAQQLTENVQSAIKAQLDAAGQIAEKAAAKGMSLDDPSIRGALGPVLQNARDIAAQGERLGVPGVSTSLVDAQIGALSLTQTPDEILARDAERERVLAQAEAEGEQAAEPPLEDRVAEEAALAAARRAPETPLAQRVAEEQALAAARASGAAAGGNVQLRTFQMPGGGFRTVEANDRDAVRGALDAGGVEVPVSVQAESGTGLTGSDASKVVREFTDLSTSSRIVLNEVERMKQQLGDDETFTAVAGSTIQGLSGAVGSLIQLGKAAGVDDTGVLAVGQYTDDIQQIFGEGPAKSAQFRSNVVNLAFMMARAAEPGGRLSDNDVRQQMRRMAVSGDKAQTTASLDEIARATRDAVRIRHEVLREQGIELPDLPGAFAPPGETKEVTTEAGETMVFEKVEGGWKRVR